MQIILLCSYTTFMSLVSFLVKGPWTFPSCGCKRNLRLREHPPEMNVQGPWNQAVTYHIRIIFILTLKSRYWTCKTYKRKYRARQIKKSYFSNDTFSTYSFYYLKNHLRLGAIIGLLGILPLLWIQIKY